jgi:hypothetical protein
VVGILSGEKKIFERHGKKIIDKFRFLSKIRNDPCYNIQRFKQKTGKVEMKQLSNI